MIQIVEIPLKPLSINQAFQGQRYKTPECKHYEECLWYLLPKKTIIKGKIHILYRFFLKNHARMDIDNLVKVLQDMIVKKGYIEDDRLIYRMVVEKVPSKSDKIQIEIKEFDFN